MNFKIRVAIIDTLLIVAGGSLTACAQSATDPYALLTPAQVSIALGTNVEPSKVSPLLCQWSVHDQPSPMNAKKVALVLSTISPFLTQKLKD
jgi:hypothetical protein